MVKLNVESHDSRVINWEQSAREILDEDTESEDEEMELVSQCDR